MKEFAERGYEEVTVDSICQKYEISKGMLYHYYSGKDALFLLCVQHTFQQLEEYLLERMEQLEQKDPVEAMQEYFLLRESFFQENPQQKQIFEAALLRAPIQLTEQIEQIRQPLIRSTANSCTAPCCACRCRRGWSRRRCCAISAGSRR